MGNESVNNIKICIYEFFFKQFPVSNIFLLGVFWTSIKGIL